LKGHAQLIRDILLQLSSYPTPTPERVFNSVVPLAAQYDARISVALCQVHFPRVSNYLANKLVGGDQAIARENEVSRDQARSLLDQFVLQVPEVNRGDQFIIDCTSFLSTDQVAVRARSFDLVILPIPDLVDREVLAADLIFGSGRPVLLLPDDSGTHPWDRIVVGWDGGRAAARALGDALPLLREARDVRLVTVAGEKPLGEGPGLEAVRTHLERHGVIAKAGEVDADGSDAGMTLLRHASEVGADLLVAGAFGHSRMRQFILGGATRSMITAATLPVLLSH
jgi:nucleotide-binding universal stress UspA family protein